MCITIITVESNVTFIDPARSAQLRAYVLGLTPRTLDCV